MLPRFDEEWTPELIKKMGLEAITSTEEECSFCGGEIINGARDSQMNAIYCSTSCAYMYLAKNDVPENIDKL